MRNKIDSPEEVRKWAERWEVAAFDRPDMFLSALAFRRADDDVLIGVKDRLDQIRLRFNREEMRPLVDWLNAWMAGAGEDG